MTLADGRRASPPESVFAALVHEAGLPAPQPQYRVLLDDRFVGRVDFAWPKRRVLVEVDGFAFHGEQGAWLRDQRRQRGLTKAGWRLLRFGAAEVLSQPDAVINDPDTPRPNMIIRRLGLVRVVERRTCADGNTSGSREVEQDRLNQG